MGSPRAFAGPSKTGGLCRRRPEQGTILTTTHFVIHTSDRLNALFDGEAGSIPDDRAGHPDFTSMPDEMTFVSLRSHPPIASS